MKILSLLSGALALSLATTPLVCWFVPTALAETPQNNPGNGAAKLDLTTTQKAKLKKIQDSANQQMTQVFTSEQKAQIQAAQQQNQKPNLNLSNDQKEKIKAIYKNTRDQINAVLTPAQKQQLQKMQSVKKASP